MPRKLLATILFTATLPAPAFASFHFMQIEQVIGGVNGDTTAQAIQLRTRSTFQHLVSQGRLIVRDAAGNNPVILLDITTNITNTASGARILICTNNFLRYTSATITPDFIMTTRIPDSYLPAGSLTFESDTGAYPSISVLWRISWGGASYTGSVLGSTTNDANGNFGTALTGALPTLTKQAFNFPGLATAPSTTNTADYTTTAGAAVVRNSSGASVTVADPTCPAASCKGDANGDNRVDGRDVPDFFKGFLSGNAIVIATVCSDMDGNNVFNASDVTLFINKQLGIGDSSPACP